MSDGFKRVPSIFTAEPGKTPLDIPKKKKKPFVSALGKSSKVLNDTVKYSSQVAKRSFGGSVASVQRVGRAVSAVQLIPKKRKGSVSSEPDDSIEQKVERLFDTQDLLFERLDSEPKLSVAMRKSLSTIRSTGRHSARYVHRQPLVAKVVAIAAISLISGGVSYLSGGEAPQSSVSEVAGVTTGEQTQAEGNPVIDTAKPTYDVLLPKGKNEDSYKFAKISPEGNEPVFAYIDTLEGQKIQVSQQVLPETFRDNPADELSKVAKSFQATDIIQIDGTQVYHGVSDKTKVQSLIFIKNKRLVFIASPQKLDDDTWVSYILSLQ